MLEKEPSDQLYNLLLLWLMRRKYIIMKEIVYLRIIQGIQRTLGVSSKVKQTSYYLQIHCNLHHIS